MENERPRFLYASKEEQQKRANRFLTVGFIVFYVFVIAIVVASCLQGIRTVGYTVMLSVIVLVFILFTVILYLRNKADTKIRYIATIGLLLVSFLISVAFDSYFIRFMAAIPFVGCVTFYDKKFSMFSLISVCGVNICTTAMKISNGGYPDGSAMDQALATFSICLLMVLTYLTASIIEQFIRDSIGSLEEKEEAQAKMLDDVIAVVGDVRKGTEHVMEIVKELNDSTNVVNGAMKDISDSTQSTAENIQTQTEMTQSIQDSLGQTLERAEKMVEVARESGELNEKSFRLMGDLKKQSEVIAQTNSEVAESMQTLQERTDAVKSIADTIFSISSQTNLLALNASIESARAGEAGRGFAVVADEIRQLAEKTRQETEHIANILEELSNNAQAAAGTVARSVTAAGAQDEMISKASESIGEMNGNVSQLVSNIDEIDGMLSSLAESNNQIVENIMHLSATTEEVTASSVHAAELSMKNLENADNAKNLLGGVMEVSYQLDKYIN